MVLVSGEKALSNSVWNPYRPKAGDIFICNLQLILFLQSLGSMPARDLIIP